MDGWTFVIFLHVLAVAFFVGGQLVFAVVVVPAMRPLGRVLIMRNAARRFGIASAVALGVIILTGAALASHFHLWGDSTLHAKLALLVVVFVLTWLHTKTPYTRQISMAVLAVSIVIMWLGVDLAN